MSQLVTRALGAAFNTLERVAPEGAGCLADALFCKPPDVRRRTAAEQRALDTLSAHLKTAQMQRVQTAIGVVQTYRWVPVGSETRAPRVLLIHGWSADARIIVMPTIVGTAIRFLRGEMP